MSGWDNKWPSGSGWFAKPNPDFEKAANEAMSKASGVPKHWISEAGNDKTPQTFIGLDKVEGSDKTTIIKVENSTVTKIAELKSQGSNLVDDQAYLYFQCEGCNEILDPHTKSFKALEDARFKAGWKVKWNIDGMGYKVYCVKCWEKV